jgi:Flp pilus assembly protein TadG
MKMHYQRGVALVEFALVLPVMMLLILGLIEVGRLTYFSIQVANAAHAGAQYGALQYANAANNTNMGTAAVDDGKNSISNLQTAGQYVCACWNWSSGTQTPATPDYATCLPQCPADSHKVTYAQVSVTGKINSIFNYSALGLPTQWVVTRVATMRVVQAE